MMLADISAEDVLRVGGHWMMVFGVALIRPLAIITISPLFVRAQVSGFIRGAVASACAVPMIPVIGHLLHEDSAPTLFFLLLTLKEALLGALLGLLLGMPFWSLEVAGQMVDYQRGSGSAQSMDEASGEEMSFSGSLFFLIGVLVFASSGGLQEAVGILYRSWHVWPALDDLPQAGSGGAAFVLTMLDKLFDQAFRLVSPLVFAMLLADMALILIARVAPQMRVDTQALSLRNLVYFIALPIYGAYMLFYIKEAMFQTPHILDTVMQFLSGHTPAPSP